MSKGKKLSEEEIQEVLGGVRSGKTKIEPAPQDEIEMLRPYVIRVLEALGHPEAWVSDLSSVWDFSPADEEGNREYIARVSVKLGFPINEKDYIIDLAMKLKAQDPDA
ncbi:MAG: hypothetical protein ACXAC5_04665 [Promethearchaeota archaeon]|jgi:hypothetical protein